MDSASILLVLATVGASLLSVPASAATGNAPIHHTSNFAGQPGWGPDTSAPPPAAAPSYERYSSPPAEIVDRTRQAVSETGNSLRDGVEAGIREANQRLSQGTESVINSTRTAGQDLNQQFQGWAGTTTQQVQQSATNMLSSPPPASTVRSQVSNPFTTAPPAASVPATTTARNGVAPPPWSGGAATGAPGWSNEMTTSAPPPRTAALGTAASQMAGGWTSVHSTLPPPPMSPPQLLNTPTHGPVANTLSAAPASQPLQPMLGEAGPGFPVTVTANQPSDRSVLSRSQQSQPAAAPSNDSWALGWDGNSTPQPQRNTTGGRYDTATLDASQNGGARATVTAQNKQPAGTPGFDPWAENDPWGDQRTASGGDATSQRNAATISNPSNTAQSSTAHTPQPATGALPQNAFPPLTTAASPPHAANGQLIGASATVPTPDPNQPPWMPLLVVSLSLAGSIGANLFLGWSYVDARQKYRNLVQKTANKFRRATATL